MGLLRLPCSEQGCCHPDYTAECDGIILGGGNFRAMMCYFKRAEKYSYFEKILWGFQIREKSANGLNFKGKKCIFFLPEKLWLL